MQIGPVPPEQVLQATAAGTDARQAQPERRQIAEPVTLGFPLKEAQAIAIHEKLQILRDEERAMLQGVLEQLRQVLQEHAAQDARAVQYPKPVEPEAERPAGSVERSAGSEL